MIDATGDVTGMNARKLPVLLACACAVAVLLALPATASAAYTTNAECLTCHDQATGSGAVSTVDFASGTTVDYTKCRSCHWIPQTQRTHGNFTHGHAFAASSTWGGYDCIRCHRTSAAGYADMSRIMSVSTPDGWFATPDPRSLNASQLHTIHVNGSWPKTVKFTTGCASCHEAAACAACHTAPPAAHTDHTKDPDTGVWVYPALAYRVGNGTPVTSPDLSTVTTSTVTCVNASCHARTAVGTVTFNKPSCPSCHPSNTADHGYSSVDHTATVGSQAEPGGTTTCAECHSMDLMTEHAKPTSAGARSCTTCHPEPFNSSVKPAGWDFACEQCHIPGGQTAKHTGMLAAHALTGDAQCLTCHTKPLAETHSAATTTTASGTFSSCLVCHNAATAATLPGKTCVSCHFAYAQHPAPVASHTATSTASTTTCGTCHDTDAATPGIDILAVHAKLACSTCHDNPSRVPDFSIVTAECSSCHSYTLDTGLDHNDFVEKHAVTADSAACWQDCHGTHTQGSTVASETIHRPTYYPTAIPNCGKCHDGTIDLTGKTASCTTCHGSDEGQTPMHADYGARHVAANAASQQCVGCHPADVAQTHEDNSYGCKLCHATSARGGAASCGFCHTPHNAAPNTPLKIYAIAECGNPQCHGDKALPSRVVTGTVTHYASHATSHTASGEPAPCADCHSMDLLTAHTNVPDACVGCHTSSEFAALSKPWDKSCEACHATRHTAAAGSHAATTTATSLDCGGSGCHAVSDVTVVHASAEVTTTGGVHLTSCQVCHKNTDRTLTTAECANCHTGHGDLGLIHAAATSTNCTTRCHAADVREVHKKSAKGACAVCHANGDLDLTGKTVECGSCHADITGSDGLDHPDYVALHTAEPENDACRTCHPHQNVSVPVYHYYTWDSAAGGMEPPDCLVCHNDTVMTPELRAKHSIACGNCHPGISDDGTVGHPEFAGSHVPTDTLSAQCTECHQPADTSVIHTAGCETCHDVSVFRCTRCHWHGDFDPVPQPAECDNYVCHGTRYPDQAMPTLDAHYASNVTTHTATETGDCAKCHKLELKPEHDKAASGAVTCAQCHTKAGFPAPWDKTCAACHTLKHTAQAMSHAATTTDSLSCAGAGCHNVADVTAIHSDASSATVSGLLTGCYVCHDSNEAPPASAECATCHTGHGDITAKHTGFASANTTCIGAGCHATRLMPDVHAPFVGAGKVFSNTCDMCHDNAALNTKLAAKGYNWTTNKPNAQCDTCHDYVAAHSSNPHWGQSHIAASTASVGCLDCHDSVGNPGQIEGAHGALSDWTKCDTCHNNPAYGGDITWNKPNSNCENCHAGESHTALHESTVVSGDISMGPGEGDTDHGPAWSTHVDCAMCHSTNLVAEHANNCALCHEGTDPAGGLGTWNGSCQQGACHPSIHTSLGPNHSKAYWGSSTSCDSCHVGEYRDGFADCGRCHTVNDYKAPTSSSDALPSYIGPARVSIGVDDPWPSSGIAHIYVKIDGATAVENSTIDFAPPASGTDVHTIEYWSVDNAGHEELTHKTATFSMTNDAAPPETTSNAKDSYSGIARIKLTATDNGTQYGVKATRYVLDDGPQVQGTAITIPNPDATASHTLEYWSVDYSNNEETHHTVSFTCTNDSTPPITTPYFTDIYVDGVPWIDFYRIFLSLYATDAEDSGVVASYGLIDGACPVGGPSTGVLYTNSSNDYTFEEGMHTLDYWSVDAVGNVEERKHIVWGEDWHGPTVTHDVGAHTANANPYIGDAHVTLTASDPHSGPKEIYYRVDGSAWTTVGPVFTVVVPAPASGKTYHTIEWNASDKVGNTFQSYGNISFWVQAGPSDTTPPSGTMSVAGGAEYSGSTAVTVDSAVTDSDSGMSQMSIDPGTGTYDGWVAYAASRAIALPSGDGLKTVNVQYKDNAGNTLTLSDTITLDTTAPSGTMVISGGAATTTSTEVTVDSSLTDIGSGMSRMRIDPGDGVFDDWIDYAATSDITLPAGAGLKTVNVEYEDVVGNKATLSDTIELAPPAPTTGTLSGRVTGTGGAALVGATVTTDKGQSTTTDGTGDFGFASLPPDTYSVTVAATGYVEQTKSGRVTAGGSTALDFELLPPAPTTGTLSGRVTSTVGAPLPGAVVSTEGGLSTPVDPEGGYSFASLTPGTYNISVSAAGYVTKVKSGIVVAGADTSVLFALPARVPGNLAYGKTFTASVSAPGYAPSLAGDDDPETFWWSNPTGAANAYETFQVDLGAPTAQRRYEIVWDAARYAKSFAIQVSDNGTSWGQITSQSTASGATYVYTRSSSLTTRYVRVICRATSGVATGYAIKEFRIFN
jgi:hypothetical protein